MFAIAALVFIASSDPSFAVVGTPPTVTCNGQCEACLEAEVAPNGSKRCLKCGIDAACMQGGDPGLSSDFTEMLNDHNAYRAQQCAGKLSWSGQLAQAAQAYARTCPSNGAGGFNHDPNRGQVGENLFWGPGTNARQAVQWWFNEIKDYDFKNPVWSAKVGHFTQVVWKDSRQLGCGVANCSGTLLWVCRYSPPGNWNVNNPGVMASQVGCAAKPVSTGGGGSGGTGGGGTGGTKLKTMTVVQAVDVYEKQGGKGRNLGFVEKGAKVQLTGACIQSWCPIKGSAVPTGKGWVYDGNDYDSLR
jgi:uncharacterized protein YkwD